MVILNISTAYLHLQEVFFVPHNCNHLNSLMTLIHFQFLLQSEKKAKAEITIFIFYTTTVQITLQRFK